MQTHEPTDAEIALAMEVEAYNACRHRASAGFLEVMRGIGLSVPQAETVGADGRWRFDLKAVEAAIGTYDRDRVSELVAALRGDRWQGCHDEAAAIELALCDRREALYTQAYKARISGSDDAAALEEELAAFQEEISGIEALGPFWALDQVNVARHRGVKARETACQERLAEIAPSPMAR